MGRKIGKRGRTPMVTPSRKRNEKILEEKESESDWEEDVDAAIEQDISKIARTE